MQTTNVLYICHFITPQALERLQSELQRAQKERDVAVAALKADMAQSGSWGCGGLCGGGGSRRRVAPA